LAIVLALLTAAPQPARALTGDEVVTRAEFALESFLGALGADDVTRVYVQNAYAVIVIPDLIKGGFVLGAEHGVGVVMVRDTVSGRFGPPAFMEIYGGSLGLQAGAKSSHVIMTVMNPKAVEAVLDGDMKLGAEFSMAVMRVGGTFGAATTTAFGEDIYVFERTAGLFGGASIAGGGLVPQRQLNNAYWGAGTTPHSIAKSFHLVDARTADLQSTLLRF
jgi:lipid-binding SYLF domain-containing protein